MFYLKPFLTPLIFLLPFTIILLLGVRNMKKQKKEGKEGYLGALSIKTICIIYAIGFCTIIMSEIEEIIFKHFHWISILAVVLTAFYELILYFILKKNKKHFSGLVFIGIIYWFWFHSCTLFNNFFI